MLTLNQSIGSIPHPWLNSYTPRCLFGDEQPGKEVLQVAETSALLRLDEEVRLDILAGAGSRILSFSKMCGFALLSRPWDLRT